MDKVFLDANYFVGLVNRVPEINIEILNKRQGFVSVLSCHILFYINNIKVPDAKINTFIDDFNIVELTKDIIFKGLEGPTQDLEDNIQLLSATETECEYFLTFDRNLLKMKFFGRTVITDKL